MQLAKAFAESQTSASKESAEIIELRFELFSVDDARRLIGAASTSGTGGEKVIIAGMTRVFHEAQNALLKILEEPPEGTNIILCIPSEGVLLSTLRSRLLPLPQLESDLPVGTPEGIAERFLGSSSAEREKILSKLVEQSKADKEETKQGARREAIELMQGLTRAAHTTFLSSKTSVDREEARLFLEDLASFMPILYERSAPLKLIFEHLLIVIPKGLDEAKV